MKHGILCINLCFLLTAPAFAATVNSEFVITNRTIESSQFESDAAGFLVTDVNGNGLYKMKDDFNDATFNQIYHLAGSWLNQQPGFKREGSQFVVAMKGEKLGYTFNVKGKYANSKVTIYAVKGEGHIESAYGDLYKNTGCISVTPSDVAVPGSLGVDYEITSDSDVNKNCVADTFYMNYGWDKSDLYIRTKGVLREVYLDAGALQKDPKYRNAPPDVYKGTAIYNKEAFVGHGGGILYLPYTNNIKITKNPYFENVTLPVIDNVFAVRTVGNDVRGDLVIPYVINGHFTPYDRIKLSLTSLNSFKLKDGSSHDIPYSLTTGIGRQQEHSLVTSGTYNGEVTINNLMNENHALQGQFNANFSVAKTAVTPGNYTDTLTAIFEIALVE